MFGKLHGKPAVWRTMQPGQEAFDHLTCDELEPSQGRQLSWLQEIGAARLILCGSSNLRHFNYDLSQAFAAAASAVPAASPFGQLAHPIDRPIFRRALVLE